MNMKLAKAVRLFGIIVALGFAMVIGAGIFALNELKIGGSLYQRIERGKDLIADILPPPAYVIEAYLESTLVLNDPSSLDARRKNLEQLHKDYNERQDYWLTSDLDGAIKAKLTERSHQEVARFWSELENKFLPAIANSDVDGVRASYGALTAAYAAHRAVIDEIVTDANAMNVATEAYAAHRNVLFMVILWSVSLMTITVVIGGVIAIARGVIRPMVRMTDVMTSLSTGVLEVDIPYRENANEVGAMAKAIEVFRANAIEGNDLRAQQEEARGQQEAEREKSEHDKRAALENMAETVESETRTAVDAVARLTKQMAGTAAQMSQSASAVAENSQNVASAAAESLANAQTVAAASEELSASIAEIASQVNAAKDITSDAVSASVNAQETIAQLASAVEQIGTVTKLISDIANQTNLLALNASIEAARAGEAGKGFAVVAGEVKSLANQTAAATGDISNQIAKVQDVTARVVESVKAITHSIQSVESVSTAIAAAVEEQNATTSEIARNVTQTSTAAQEVTQRIAEVSDEANATDARASDVSTVSGEVAVSIEHLREVIVRIVRTSTKDVDRRRAPRYPVERHGQVHADAKAVAMTVQNLSEGGALLIGPGPERRVGDTLDVSIDGFNGRLPAKVVGIGPERLNVKFNLPIEQATQFAEQLRTVVEKMTVLKQAV